MKQKVAKQRKRTKVENLGKVAPEEEEEAVAVEQ